MSLVKIGTTNEYVNPAIAEEIIKKKNEKGGWVVSVVFASRTRNLACVDEAAANALILVLIAAS